MQQRLLFLLCAGYLVTIAVLMSTTAAVSEGPPGEKGGAGPLGITFSDWPSFPMKFPKGTTVRVGEKKIEPIDTTNEKHDLYDSVQMM